LASSRILVAVSSPWASEKLTAPNNDLAHRLDASVMIAHLAQQHEQDEKESDARERGEQTLNLLTDAMKAAGIEADSVLLFSDDVPKAILNTARARDCTLIVLGLTGKGMLKRLIAGDVPGNLIKQTELPVLLFPPNSSQTI
jgi:nucleotide-binding universal stress UspA family protein